MGKGGQKQTLTADFSLRPFKHCSNLTILEGLLVDLCLASL